MQAHIPSGLNSSVSAQDARVFAGARRLDLGNGGADELETHVFDLHGVVFPDRLFRYSAGGLIMLAGIATEVRER